MIWTGGLREIGQVFPYLVNDQLSRNPCIYGSGASNEGNNRRVFEYPGDNVSYAEKEQNKEQICSIRA